MNDGDYKKLHPNLSEVRRMLTSFLEAIESGTKKQDAIRAVALAKG